MDLKQLRCFTTLAEIGNIRRAASLSALSQPALSMRLQRLEEQLGYALFEREARGVRLTERGRRLLPHAKRLLEVAAGTEEAALQIGRGAFDRLDIGVTPIAALSIFPRAIRAFSIAHPAVALALTEGLSHELEDAVAQRRLDFAIVHPPSSRDDLVVHEVARERFVAVVPAEHRLAAQGSIAVRDMADVPMLAVRRDVGPAVFDRLAAHFTRAGIAARFDQCATSSISLLGLVAAGLGAALVVESLRCIEQPGVRFIALADEPPTLGYALCHRADLPNPVRNAFVRALTGSRSGPGLSAS
jgi:LysR family transcriptional regulator, benzoate and cis,cis-muconate-responsive activator of ben and cat genes